MPNWVENVELLMDNTTKTNKSQYVLAICAYLIKIHKFRSLTLSFMLPGHTKVIFKLNMIYL